MLRGTDSYILTSLLLRSINFDRRARTRGLADQRQSIGLVLPRSFNFQRRDNCQGKLHQTRFEW